MKLNLGENIRQNRRKLDLTQEELAERLGVSYQSVSRWENGSTYPDMEFLPELAEIFGVTVDCLLGYEDEAVKRQADKYLADFKAALSYGGVGECIRIAREGVAAFPNNYALLNNLMYALFMEGDSDGDNPDWQEATKRNDAEIVSLGERIVKYCPDEYIRAEAKIRLAFEHCEMGRKAEGRAIYETLPPYAHCREMNIAWALEGKEAEDNRRWQIATGFELLGGALREFCRHQPDEKKLEVVGVMKTIENIRHGGEGRIGSEHWDEYQVAMMKAGALARLGRADEMFAALRKAAAEAVAFDAWHEDESMETPFEGTITERRSAFETDEGRGARGRMLERSLAISEFDAYRETEELREIVASLS